VLAQGHILHFMGDLGGQLRGGAPFGCDFGVLRELA
jgi:hypothetical protein